MRRAHTSLASRASAMWWPRSAAASDRCSCRAADSKPGGWAAGCMAEAADAAVLAAAASSPSRHSASDLTAMGASSCSR